MHSNRKQRLPWSEQVMHLFLCLHSLGLWAEELEVEN